MLAPLELFDTNYQDLRASNALPRPSKGIELPYKSYTGTSDWDILHSRTQEMITQPGSSIANNA